MTAPARGFPVVSASLVALGLVALLVLGAELAARWQPVLRVPVYLGGVGALLACACALPSLARLARVAGEPDSDGRFWKLWGASIAARLLAGLAVAAVAMPAAGEYGDVALGSMSLMYLAALMAESVWIAKLCQTGGAKDSATKQDRNAEGDSNG